MRIAIVTGASSGIGKEFVKQIEQFYKDLDEIWVIARREAQLIELKNVSKMNLRIFSGDLEGEEIFLKLQEALKESKPQIRMLVNAAGFGKVGKIEDIAKQDAEIQLRMIDLNCRSLTKMTCISLPYMSAGSRIINIASASAFFPQSGFSVYAATKSYVLSFSRSLHQELKPRKISVTAVCPGPVKTEFFAVSGKSGSRMKESVMAEPDAVVKQALKDAKDKRAVSVYGIPMKASRMMTKLIPHSVIIPVMEMMNKIH